jgi:hypothetical protein
VETSGRVEKEIKDKKFLMQVLKRWKGTNITYLFLSGFLSDVS